MKAKLMSDNKYIAGGQRRTISRILLTICLLSLHAKSGEARPRQSQGSSGAATPANHSPQQGTAVQVPNPSPSLPAPAIRSTTRLVKLSVVVHDKHGQPITGLGKDDFVILDKKKPQPVQVFFTRTAEPRGHSLEPLPSDTYSNRMADQSAPSSATVILLDGLNTRSSDLAYARYQIVKFLKQIQPQDRVALYTLGTDLTLVHDFTSDSTSLLAALQNFGEVRAPLQKETAAPGTSGMSAPPESLSVRLGTPDASMLDPFLKSISRDERDFISIDTIGRTIQALKEIGNHVALLPGRKNLIWVSGSFVPASGLQDVELNTPDGAMLFTTGIDSMANALNNASLVVYPVDARGLFAYPANNGEFEAMDAVAQRTDGRAFYNTNDIFGAIRKAIDDSLVSYELGYYPDVAKWDGSFHKIQVKVKQTGASVRTREGYFAVSDPKITPEVHKSLFAGAMTNLLVADGIGITVHVKTPKGEAANGHLSVSLVLNSDDLSVESKDGRWTGGLDTMLVQLDAKGVVLGATDDAFQFHLTPEKYQQMARYGLSYREDSAILTGASEVRVVVRDASSGKVGAVKVPLARYISASGPAN
jgi:VWFA-related protein